MNIKVKNTEPGGRHISFAINKSTSVLDLKKLVKNDFGVSEEYQRLYFRGKLMENPIKVYDYGLSMNKTIQLVIRRDESCPAEVKKEVKKTPPKGGKESPKKYSAQSKLTPKKGQMKASRKSAVANNISEYFKVGDWVDFKDLSSEDTAHQGWFEGRIIDIIEYSDESDRKTSEILYEVQHRRSSTEPPIFVSLSELRPISRVNIKPADLNVGDTVLANYNPSDPSKRGYWFDLIVTEMDRTSTRHIIHGTIIAGPLVLEDCVMMYPNELMKIEPVKLHAERTKNELKIMQAEPSIKRYCAAACSSCMDLPGRKCRQCGCAYCFSKKDPEKQLICDDCQNYFHIYCLKKPLDELPDGDWFCDSCQSTKRTPSNANPKPEEVDFEEKVEVPDMEEKKEVELEIREFENNEDWESNPMNNFYSNHKPQFGPIEGLPVGTTFRFKAQTFQTGLHRAPMANIHFRKARGVYSIILDKEFDVLKDKGDNLYLSWPDEAAWKKIIKSFAANLPAPFSTSKKVGPSNWSDGKPIRIIRSHQCGSKFSPKLGFRYDGLYKLVKYSHESTGTKRLYQFHLRRIDETPAPWTEKGKKRISELGLGSVIHPLKRNSSGQNDGPVESPPKLLNKTVLELISRDADNASTWERLMKCLPSGKELFIKQVSREFTCKGCQKMVCIPITTPCGHNSCLSCLQKMFKSQKFVCPSCKNKLGSRYLILRNHRLRDILLNFFPGYDIGR